MKLIPCTSGLFYLMLGQLFYRPSVLVEDLPVSQIWIFSYNAFAVCQFLISLRVLFSKETIINALACFFTVTLVGVCFRLRPEASYWVLFALWERTDGISNPLIRWSFVPLPRTSEWFFEFILNSVLLTCNSCRYWLFTVVYHSILFLWMSSIVLLLNVITALPLYNILYFSGTWRSCSVCSSFCITDTLLVTSYL